MAEVIVPQIGDKFGRWIVVGETIKIQRTDKEGKRSGYRYKVCVECSCDKKTKATKDLHSLRGGGTLSCGCWRSEVCRNKVLTHGKRHTPEYNVWCHIKARCFNPKNRSYHDYGGRGITMCDRWKNDFESFLEDVGVRPEGKESIDRVDNLLGYSCGKCDHCKKMGWQMNCKWADRIEQNRNKRSNRMLTCDGVTKPLQDWANGLGVNHTTIIGRLKRGWSVKDAVTTPPKYNSIA